MFYFPKAFDRTQQFQLVFCAFCQQIWLLFINKYQHFNISRGLRKGQRRSPEVVHQEAYTSGIISTRSASISKRNIVYYRFRLAKNVVFSWKFFGYLIIYNVFFLDLFLYRTHILCSFVLNLYYDPGDRICNYTNKATLLLCVREELGKNQIICI